MAKKSDNFEFEISDTSLLYLLAFGLVLTSFINSYLVLQVNNNVQALGETILSLEGSVPQAAPEGSDDSEQRVEPEETDDPMQLLQPETRELVEKYSISGTPALIINCNNKRVGSYALAEEQGQLPEGSTLQALINDLCSIAGEDSVFCSDTAETNATGISVQKTSHDECGSSGNVQIYSFHSPTCGFCDSQDSVLEELEEKYPGSVEITTVCTPIHGVGDVDLCKEQTDKYDMI